MKKVISVLLCLVMLLSVCGVTSFAQDGENSVTSSVSGISSFFDGIKEFFENIIKLFRSFFAVFTGDTVFAADDIVFEVNGQSVAVELNNNQNYLYLPSFADRENIKVVSETNATITIDGKSVSNGDTVKLTDDEFRLKVNKESDYVTVVKSGKVSSLFISTESGNMDAIHANKSYKESGTAAFVDKSGNVEYDGNLDSIKGRGSSSWKYAKKGYNIKLEKKANLDDMGKTKKYSLIPNYIDKSLLRNYVMYTLGDECGLEYTPECTPVDLYLNGLYNGTYLLVVKTDVDKASVDITDLEGATEDANGGSVDTFGKVTVKNTNGLVEYKYVDIPNNPDDITGGYILELDHSGYQGEASGFISPKNQSVVVKSPEYASKAQVEYIAEFFRQFEEAAYSDDGYNSLHKHYTEYIDEESFALYFLLTEFAENGDSNITSVFMYKESDITGDGLLHAGPLWDFDSGLQNNGGTKYFDVNIVLSNPEYQFFGDTRIYKTSNITLYTALYRQKDFRELAQKLYKSNVAPAIDTLLGYSKNSKYTEYNTLVNEISSSAAMNFVRWQIIEKKFTGYQTGTTYAENIKTLREFMTKRYAFMNKVIDLYDEDYIYIFIVNDNYYGVLSFDDYSVECYKGDATVGDTVSFGAKTFNVVSVKE